MSISTMFVAAAAALSLAAGCGPRVAHTFPEAMSVEAHRAEADRHLAAARVAADRARLQHGSHVASSGPGDSWQTDRSRWLTAEWVEETEAYEHLVAAHDLEADYAIACALTPAAEQAMSPLDIFIVGYERVADAVIVHLAREAGPPAHLLHQLRCHRAFMALRGLDERPGCPLAVRGLTIEVVPRANGIDVRLTPHERGRLPDLVTRTRATLARAR